MGVQLVKVRWEGGTRMRSCLPSPSLRPGRALEALMAQSYPLAQSPWSCLLLRVGRPTHCAHHCRSDEGLAGQPLSSRMHPELRVRQHRSVVRSLRTATRSAWAPGSHVVAGAIYALQFDLLKDLEPML